MAKRSARLAGRPAVSYYDARQVEDFDDDEGFVPSRPISRRKRKSSAQSERTEVAPVPPRVSKRRIIDSDESDDQTPVDSAASSSELKAEPLPTPRSTSLPLKEAKLGQRDEGDDESDSQLGDPDIVEDEQEFDDDEYIAGPDDEDGRGQSTEAAVLAAPAARHIVQQIPESISTTDLRFKLVLRGAIMHLKNWALGVDWKVFAESGAIGPVSFNFWQVLRKVDDNMLEAMYFHAHRPEARALLARTQWTKADFLSLPQITENDSDQGIYLDLADGAIAHQHLNVLGFDLYVGSSQDVHKRVLGSSGSGSHAMIAEKYSPATLPEKIKRSFHYLQICRAGVNMHPRMVADFGSSPVASGYQYLLKGIDTILFGVYNYPGWASTWAPESSYDLVREVRESLDLPPVQWRGMNAAFQLKQGFSHEVAKGEHKCEWCGNSCANKKYLLDPMDPLGLYICDACGRHRYRTTNLPTEWEIYEREERMLRTTESHQRNSDTRAEHGDDPTCYMCGITRSEEKATYTSAVKSFISHPGYPGELFCKACSQWLKRNDGQLRPQIQTDMEVLRRQVFGPLGKLAKGETISCDNCPATTTTKNGWSVSDKDAGEVKLLCKTCAGRLREARRPPDWEKTRYAQRKAKKLASEDA